MKTTKIIYCISALIFLSCSQGNLNEMTNTINIDPDKYEKNIDLSPILKDTFEIIKLENGTDNMISRIKKIKFTNDYIFISDEVAESIFIFDKSGSFVQKIIHKGQGPNEYLRLNDFFVKDNKIYIQDSGRGRILIYSINDEFIAALTIKPKAYYDEFFYLDNNIYLINNYALSDAGTYKLYKYNLENAQLDKYLPYDRKKGDSAWGLRNYHGKYKDDVLITYAQDDVIYKIIDNVVTSEYKIYFTNNRLPQDIKEEDALDIMTYAINNNYTIGLESLQHSANYIFSSFSVGRNSKNVLIDKNNLSSKVGEWFTLDKLGSLYATNVTITDNDELVIIQDAYMLIDAWTYIYSKNAFHSEDAKNKIQAIIDDITEDDNPIIFKFHFK